MGNFRRRGGDNGEWLIKFDSWCGKDLLSMLLVGVCLVGAIIKGVDAIL